MNLFRIAVRVAIRSTSDKFLLDKFRTISDEDALKYARSKLELLGEGSSRIVFILSSNKVLKISKNDAGIAQNEAEVDIYTRPNIKPIVTKIFDFASDYSWVISELVRPATESDIENELGIDLNQLVSMANWMGSDNDYDQACEHFLEGIKPKSDSNLKRMIRAIQELVNKGLQIGDVQRISSWGKTADGRLVLLDYGFTEEVADDHYNSEDTSDFEDWDDEQQDSQQQSTE